MRFGRLFAHRVVRRRCQPVALLFTRGDAMAQEDPPVLEDELIGCVVAVLPGRRLLYRLRRLRFQLTTALLACFRRRAVGSP
jgi:hypothetical protein